MVFCITTVDFEILGSTIKFWGGMEFQQVRNFWHVPSVFILVFSQYSQQNQAMLAQVLRTLIL